ncbi:MAG TPA: prolipoprotein diacylglyceryl transferase [Phycisphaerales bacterium]|nr:prolipoprotein diacylglyceryl transferase [Phycisphaerales bacterium]HMP36177.1 prolipoprotein diacylglyceryl transferase [Phycisphaerales bacterium]
MSDAARHDDPEGATVAPSSQPPADPSTRSPERAAEARAAAGRGGASGASLHHAPAERGAAPTAGSTIGKLGYGALFVVVLPLLLVAWAARLSATLDLPTAHAPALGAASTAAGLAIAAWAMLALWRRGGGLPMNAYPPPRLVTSGPFRLVAHPIYVGFAVACAGVALMAGSPGGFWVVAPTVAAGSAALVLGHEGPALRRRFPKRPRPIVALPATSLDSSFESEGGAPKFMEVLGLWLAVLLPWLIAYEFVGHLPVPGAIETWLPFERAWPVWTWTTLIYSSAYPFVVLAPLAARTRHALRSFALVGLIGSGLGLLTYLVLPLIAPPRDFDAGAFAGPLLAFERADGLAGRAACPAFHVFWTFAAAALIARRGGIAAIAAWTWALAIAASCATTGMHSIIDIAAGAALFAIASSLPRGWLAAVRAAERLANAWRAWRLGPARVINHGIFAGIAAAVGVLVAGTLAGASAVGEIAIVAISALVGAALWGQFWTGSRLLTRPFGYFGAVLGAAAALAGVALAGGDAWLLAAASAVAAPWVQAIGRLRCLVQGCCHGAPVDGPSALRVVNPNSRVVFVSGLGGVGIHPTPLYSIAANLVIAALLARLWAIRADASFVLGAYLLLAGLSRFVEEGLRGEAQTQHIGGLRLYQWCAIASAIAGAGLTAVAAPLEARPPELAAATIGAAAALGLLFGFAMGVDFPGSTRRFSRLT